MATLSVRSAHDRWLDWSRDKFGLLFALISINYVALILLPDDQSAVLFGSVIVVITALFSLDVAGAHPKVRIVIRSLVLALPVLVGLFFTGVPGLRAPIGLLFAGLLLVSTYVILRHVIGHETITMATLLAALCVYVLIGLVFTELFVAAAVFKPAEPFLAQVVHPSRSDLVYLSYVTLTTVGFGDLTPKTDIARTLVITEALVGQIFLVTAVARVVSLFGTQRRQPPAEPSA